MGNQESSGKGKASGPHDERPPDHEGVETAGSNPSASSSLSPPKPKVEDVDDNSSDSHLTMGGECQDSDDKPVGATAVDKGAEQEPGFEATAMPSCGKSDLTAAKPEFLSSSSPLPRSNDAADEEQDGQSQTVSQASYSAAAQHKLAQKNNVEEIMECIEEEEEGLRANVTLNTRKTMDDGSSSLQKGGREMEEGGPRQSGQLDSELEPSLSTSNKILRADESTVKDRKTEEGECGSNGLDIDVNRARKVHLVKDGTDKHTDGNSNCIVQSPGLLKRNITGTKFSSGSPEISTAYKQSSDHGQSAPLTRSISSTARTNQRQENFGLGNAEIRQQVLPETINSTDQAPHPNGSEPDSVPSHPPINTLASGYSQKPSFHSTRHPDRHHIFNPLPTLSPDQLPGHQPPYQSGSPFGRPRFTMRAHLQNPPLLPGVSMLSPGEVTQEHTLNQNSGSLPWSPNDGSEHLNTNFSYPSHCADMAPNQCHFADVPSLDHMSASPELLAFAPMFHPHPQHQQWPQDSSLSVAGKMNWSTLDSTSTTVGNRPPDEETITDASCTMDGDFASDQKASLKQERRLACKTTSPTNNPPSENKDGQDQQASSDENGAPLQMTWSTMDSSQSDATSQTEKGALPLRHNNAPELEGKATTALDTPSTNNQHPSDTPSTNNQHLSDTPSTNNQHPSDMPASDKQLPPEGPFVESGSICWTKATAFDMEQLESSSTRQPVEDEEKSMAANSSMQTNTARAQPNIWQKTPVQTHDGGAVFATARHNTGSSQFDGDMEINDEAVVENMEDKSSDLNIEENKGETITQTMPLHSELSPTLAQPAFAQSRPPVAHGRGRGGRFRRTLPFSPPSGLSSFAPKFDANAQAAQEPTEIPPTTEPRQSTDHDTPTTESWQSTDHSLLTHPRRVSKGYEDEKSKGNQKTSSDKITIVQCNTDVAAQSQHSKAASIVKDPEEVSQAKPFTKQVVELTASNSAAAEADDGEWQERSRTLGKGLSEAQRNTLHKDLCSPAPLLGDIERQKVEWQDGGGSENSATAVEDRQCTTLMLSTPAHTDQLTANDSDKIHPYSEQDERGRQIVKDWALEPFGNDADSSDIPKPNEPASWHAAPTAGRTGKKSRLTDKGSNEESLGELVGERTGDRWQYDTNSSADWGEENWGSTRQEKRMNMADAGVLSTSTTASVQRKPPPKFGSNTARRLTEDRNVATIRATSIGRGKPCLSSKISHREEGADVERLAKPDADDQDNSQSGSKLSTRESKDEGAVIRVNNLPETSMERVNTETRDFLIHSLAKYINQIRSIFVLTGHAFVNFTSSTLASEAYKHLTDHGLSYKGVELIFTLYTDRYRVQRSIAAEARRPQGRIMPHEVAILTQSSEDGGTTGMELSHKRVDESDEIEAVIRITGFKGVPHLVGKMFLTKAFSKYADAIAGIYFFTLTSTAFLNFSSKEQAMHANQELAGKLAYKGQKLKLVVNTDESNLQKAKANQEKYKDHYIFSSKLQQERDEGRRDPSDFEDLQPSSNPPKTGAVTDSSLSKQNPGEQADGAIETQARRHTVWVGNVSNLKGHVRQREGILLDLFQKYTDHIGDIAVFERFAFINFTERGPAEAAINDVRKACPLFNGQQLIFRLDKADVVENKKKAVDSSLETDKKTVFLKDLPQTASNKQVRAAFGHLAYHITSLDVHKDPRSGQRRCYAFVRFRSIKALNQVMFELGNKLTVEGVSVTMKPLASESKSNTEEEKPSAMTKTLSAASKSPMRKAVATLAVKNVPVEMTEDKLMEDLFWDCSDGILSLRTPQNPDGQRKGVAYVDFTSQKDAESVLERLSGIEYQGRRLLIENCRSSSGFGSGNTKSQTGKTSSISPQTEGRISDLSSPRWDSVFSKTDQNESASRVKSWPNTPSPADDRVRLEQYMSKEAFHFVQKHWAKELNAARLADNIEVTWSNGTAVILGHSDKAIDHLMEQVLDLVAEDDIELSHAEMTRWTRKVGKGETHLSKLFKKHEDENMGIHVDRERDRLLLFGEDDSVDRHLDDIQLRLKKCYPLTIYQIKLLNKHYPSLQHDITKEYKVKISALESDMNTLYFTSSGGSAQVESAMLQLDNVLQNYNEESLQLDSALLVPAMKFIRSHGDEIMVFVDEEEWSGESVLAVEMDMEKSIKQTVTISCIRGDVVNKIHSKLVGGPVTQQISLRVDLLRVVLGSGDLQLATIAEVNGVAYSLWMPDASSTALQGCLQFLSWRPEDAQAAVTTVNITIMAENKMATRQLNISSLRQQYLVNVLYRHSDSDVMAAFEAAVKDIGRLEAKFDESKREVMIKGPKYKMTLLERRVIEDPVLLGDVVEEHIVVKAPAAMHSLVKEKYLDAAVKGTAIVMEANTLNGSLPMSTTVRSLVGQLGRIEVSQATGGHSAAISVSLCGKQTEVDQTVHKIKESLSVLQQFIVLALTDEEYHVTLRGLTAAAFHEITSTHHVHIVFLGLEPGGGPLAILGGEEDEQLRGACTAMQSCLCQCLKPPDPPKPYAVLTQLQERYLVCQRQGWVTDFEQRHSVAIAYGQPSSEDYQHGKTELWQIQDVTGGQSSGENVNAAARDLHKVVDDLSSANLEINFPAELTPLVESSLSYSLQFIEAKHNVACLFTRLSSCDELTLGGVTSTICTAAVNVCADEMALVSSAMTALQGIVQDHQSVMLDIPAPVWPLVQAERAKLEVVHGVILLPCWASAPQSEVFSVLLLASTKEAVTSAHSHLMQLTGHSQSMIKEFPIDGNHGSLFKHLEPNHCAGVEALGCLSESVDLSAGMPKPIPLPEMSLTMGRGEERTLTEKNNGKEEKEAMREKTLEKRNLDAAKSPSSAPPTIDKVSSTNTKDIEQQVCVPGPVQPILLQTLQDIFSVSVTTKTRDEGYSDPIFSPSVDVTLCGNSDDVKDAVRYLQEQLCQE